MKECNFYISINNDKTIQLCKRYHQITCAHTSEAIYHVSAEEFNFDYSDLNVCTFYNMCIVQYTQLWFQIANRLGNIFITIRNKILMLVEVSVT